ncbi:MAG: hypothetical protein EXQ89_07000 [Rhodospirillaceae bacterium]|nr:hypothetical protein [Rhodospirillaceae bacterium]
MPFNKPLRPYAMLDVTKVGAGQVGVYGLFSRGACVYVGVGDIREKVLGHLIGDSAAIGRAAPDQWTAEITPNHAARAKALIAELNPTCNRKAG